LVEARVLLAKQLNLLSRTFELERLTLDPGSHDESVCAGRGEHDGYRSDHHPARADLGLLDPGAQRSLFLALELVLQLGRMRSSFLFRLDAKLGFQDSKRSTLFGFTLSARLCQGFLLGTPPCFLLLFVPSSRFGLFALPRLERRCDSHFLFACNACLFKGMQLEELVRE